ncbi:MAG TPA: glutamate mutase L [candidate division Zixibacteria bacterium]|nr:glutamate mutase L [candidate division Zixibacteria bacterium]
MSPKAKDFPSDAHKRRVMVAAIGACVHNLGVESFAEWMEDKDLGYIAVKLGPAVPIPELVSKIREARPEVVGISMRLGDLHVDKLIGEFVELATQHGLHPSRSGIRYAFSGLRPAANVVRAMTGVQLEPDPFTPEDERHFDLDAVALAYRDQEEFQGFFQLVADDFITMEELEGFAQGRALSRQEQAIEWSDFLVERIKQVRELEDRPILRAHIGIAADTIEPTVEAVEKLADAHTFEIVSLAPDQPSQEMLAKFIRGEEDPDKYLRGQGGAPIRTLEDLTRLKAASRRGNFPMTRIYTGTDELLALAHLWQEYLNSCFPAVPVFFYNELDGRGPISIRDSFTEHFSVIRWWAEQGKPVEINDPHQWGLRYASDDMQVTDHVLCALIALKLGVKHYVMQMMFELPPEISAMDDLAKMKAAYELVEPLTRHFNFNIIRETRSGLPSFPPNLHQAKGHLAFGTYTQLYMEPDILHVVSFPEAHHEAKAEDIIESCELVKQVCWDFQKGHVPDIWSDPILQARKHDLKKGALYNVLHGALIGGYRGPVTVENFWDWAKEPEDDPERNFETAVLSFADEGNYRTGTCGVISPDSLDLGLQIGLYQAPHVTVVDRRYQLSGACRIKVVNGMCCIDECYGIKVSSEFERVDLVRQRFPWYFDENIRDAADESFITEEVEPINRATVLKARRSLGLRKKDLDKLKVLVVDFGSTFTKVGILDAETEQFQLRYEPTTPDDIREGLANGLGVLPECQEQGDWRPLEASMNKFDVRLPCSSAKGGLKMVTVSLVKDESGFAADLAALTAGAKLLNSYQGKLTPEQARQIYEVEQPEIILLAGGVDYGGDTETQVHNARMLAENAQYASHTDYGVPVIYAGNQDCLDKVERIFTDNRIDIRMTENVMPEVNTFHIEVVNEAIRELFQTVIIRGKGFDVAEKYMNEKFIPTPRAAFRGINLLAKGYGDQAGLGSIMALDIGGATTDFYSNVLVNPLYAYPGRDHAKRLKRAILKTPNTPLAYRRVEGKYGLSYNAENIKEISRYQNGGLSRDLNRFLTERYPAITLDPLDQFSQFVSRTSKRILVDLAGYISWVSVHPLDMPQTRLENATRSFLASEIMNVATRRNLGHVEETETYFMQYGVNFFNQPVTTLLIGGTIYHKMKSGNRHLMKDLSLIAQGALYNPDEPDVLRPNGPVLLDASYLVSILGGMYGRIDPERALRVMLRELVPLDIVE